MKILFLITALLFSNISIAEPKIETIQLNHRLATEVLPKVQAFLPSNTPARAFNNFIIIKAEADVINNIKEGSIEMELISLNAMTVALKSGTAGKAFSFITDELKKLSAQTIKLTDQLTINGKHQLTLFEKFGKKIEFVCRYSARAFMNSCSEIFMEVFPSSTLDCTSFFEIDITSWALMEAEKNKIIMVVM